MSNNPAMIRQQVTGVIASGADTGWFILPVGAWNAPNGSNPRNACIMVVATPTSGGDHFAANLYATNIDYPEETAVTARAKASVADAIAASVTSASKEVGMWNTVLIGEEMYVRVGYSAPVDVDVTVNIYVTAR